MPKVKSLNDKKQHQTFFTKPITKSSLISANSSSLSMKKKGILKTSGINNKPYVQKILLQSNERPQTRKPKLTSSTSNSSNQNKKKSVKLKNEILKEELNFVFNDVHELIQQPSSSIYAKVTNLHNSTSYLETPPAPPPSPTFINDDSHLEARQRLDDRLRDIKFLQEDMLMDSHASSLQRKLEALNQEKQEIFEKTEQDFESALEKLSSL